MPSYRFYTAEKILTKGQTVALEESEQTHLIKVMRGAVGDLVEIVNGNGYLASAKIESIEKKRASLHLEKVHFAPPPPPLILAQALLKLPKLEWIFEKATELGATAFYLFPAAHSEIKEISLQKIARLRAITISAMKQCGSLYLPSIEILPPLKKFPFPDLPCYFMDMSGTPLDRPTSPAALFIGPEKGWTDEEKTLLSEKSKCISVHSNTLRSETAAIFSVGLFGR